MTKRPRITAEKVIEVRDTVKKFPNASPSDVAKFSGISTATTNRILKGQYDHLLEHKDSDDYDNVDLIEVIDILKKNNALLADIATMLVNMGESFNPHQATKETEARFRSNIVSNRVQTAKEK